LQYKNYHHLEILAFTGPENESTVVKYVIFQQKVTKSSKIVIFKRHFSHFY